jgi:predicted nucleic acid-binding protein
VADAAFWDASALVKAYLVEDGSANVKSALALRTRGFISDLVAVEVMTTLGKKRRSLKIDRTTYRRAVDEFNADLGIEFDVVNVDPHVTAEARTLATKYYHSPASAMDLLHLAATKRLASVAASNRVVLVACDRALLDAAASEGLATYNPETQPHAALRSALRSWN